MYISVMGAGSVGGYFGGMLALAGHDVTLIVRSARADTLRKNGFSIKTDGDTMNPPVRIVADAESLPTADLLLFSVKLYSNIDAINAIKPMIKEGTVILALQNGVLSGSELAAAYGAERVMEAAVYIEAEKGDAGVIQSGSTPKVIIGSRKKDYLTTAIRTAEVLNVPGIHAASTEDIESELWTKLVSVGAFGALVAASRSSLSELASDVDALVTLRNIMTEIASVAAASGVNLSENVVEEKLSEGLAEAESYRSSMLQDLQNGSPLEFDWLLGDVITRAAALKIPVPASSAIASVLNPLKNGQYPPA